MGTAPDSEFEAWEVDLHGHRAIYRAVGGGPPVVLIHDELTRTVTSVRFRPPVERARYG